MLEVFETFKAFESRAFKMLSWICSHSHSCLGDRLNEQFMSATHRDRSTHRVSMPLHPHHNDPARITS